MCQPIGLTHSLLVGVLLPRCGAATHSKGPCCGWGIFHLAWTWSALPGLMIACHVKVVVHVYLTYSNPLGWQVEGLTNSTLFGAHPKVMLLVRVHPVYSGNPENISVRYSAVGLLLVVEIQGISRLALVCCSGVAHERAQVCRCSDVPSSSTPGGVCKTCGSASLATWSMKTCGSECWKAWSSSSKLRWRP